MRELCGKMIKKGAMTEARPCIRKKSHSFGHTPNLKGLQFGKGIAISKAPFRIYSNGNRETCWYFKNQYGEVKSVIASKLLNGLETGFSAVRGSKLSSSRAGGGGTRPEYAAIYNHFDNVFNLRNKDHNSYKNMIFYSGWNPRKGGSPVAGMRWIIENLGRKPGRSWELHVLKTKKYPCGFFGPGGIAWRHKMDRHEQNVLDLIAEWTNKKWQEFVKQENRRRKR